MKMLRILATYCHLKKFRAVANRKVLILPASTPGNLGDAAMILGLLHLLRSNGEKRFLLIDYSQHESWSDELGLSSGGVLPASLKDYMAWSFCLSKISHLYINGADVLDGKYSLERTLQRLRFAYFVAHAGIPVTITGFSMRDDPPEEVIYAFKKLPNSVRLCLRDPLSFDRVKKINSDSVKQVADLAFMLQPSLKTEYEKKIYSVLQMQIDRGKIPVGFCLNLHSVKLSHLKVSEKIDWLMSCMNNVLNRILSVHKNVCPVFIPHDFRGDPNDVRINEALALKCGYEEDDFIIVNEAVSAPAVKMFCSKLRILITGRMHCGIAALGSGVPVIFFDYQGKVKGLTNFFDLNTSVEAQKNPNTTAEEIFGHFIEYNSNHSYYREKILSNLSMVMNYSRANVDA